MSHLLRDTGVEDERLEAPYGRCYDICDICMSTGWPRDRKKVSIAHMNDAFNSAIQAEYLVVYIRGGKFEVLNVVDAETGYGEREIAPERKSNDAHDLDDVDM